MKAPDKSSFELCLISYENKSWYLQKKQKNTKRFSFIIKYRSFLFKRRPNVRGYLSRQVVFRYDVSLLWVCECSDRSVNFNVNLWFSLEICPSPNICPLVYFCLFLSITAKLKKDKMCGPRSVVVSVQGCYASDLGSIPGPGKKISEGWKCWAVFL